MRHAIVIGGGPAGSVAALSLARSGWGVTLVEQHRFPRDKVCGECLSALGAEVLSRLGLFDELLRHEPARLSRTSLHAPSGASVTAILPRPMWGVSRVSLDGMLLDAARREGVAVRQPARAEAVEPGLRPSVALRDLVTNSIETINADCVIVADGKAALLGGGDGPPRPTADLGIKSHFTNVDGPDDCIELFGTADCYGGLAPIEGGRWNAAFSVPATRVRDSRGDLDALFTQLVSENVTLARRLAGASRAGPWLAAPLPRFAVQRRWPQNVIPVGNAAAAIEPIGGEGMGLAIRSAELGAAALAGSETWHSRSAHRLAADYRKLWSARGLACRAAARAVSSRRHADRFMPLLEMVPASVRPVLAMMGK
jgi:2-polyprenyl-6-methoxyphenol hydroxylase-like FAD-dependent oxidoreductase